MDEANHAASKSSAEHLLASLLASLSQRIAHGAIRDFEAFGSALASLKEDYFKVVKGPSRDIAWAEALLGPGLDALKAVSAVLLAERNDAMAALEKKLLGQISVRFSALKD